MKPERLKRLVELMIKEHGNDRVGSARKFYRLKRLFDAVVEPVPVVEPKVFTASDDWYYCNKCGLYYYGDSPNHLRTTYAFNLDKCNYDAVRVTYD